MSEENERHQELLKKSLAGLRRASVAARKRSVATGTPLIVWEDGKIVDLNAAPSHDDTAEVESMVVREEPEIQS